MLFWLANHFSSDLAAHGLGFLRVFTFPTFQALAAALVSFFFVLAAGPRTIRKLRALKIGDTANFDEAHMNELMKSKKGVPTMGGVLMIAAILIATLLLADLNNFYVLMALVCFLLLGALGMTDDFLKLTAARRNGSRDGLTSREKLLFQIGLAIILSWFTYSYGGTVPEATRYYLPFVKDGYLPVGQTDIIELANAGQLNPARTKLYVWLGFAFFVLLGTLILTGFSNAVNLTDGLDGLAAGTLAIASFSFLILALITGESATSKALLMPFVKGSDQMAVLAAAMVGACLGFLWFNCSPASVFMGDTGSLALGGLLGYVAIVVRQEILLCLIGGIFVVEAISVIIQKGVFKFTRIYFGEGRRVFRMAPIHHHFQKKGWTETQVVTRFWLIGAMLAALALATVKLR